MIAPPPPPPDVVPPASDAGIWWRWRFQPVWGAWGHLGLDYTFEDPHADDRDFLLRHVDYGLPGDRTNPLYRQSIALYCAMVSPNGRPWPPLRTPKGYGFLASAFQRAPRSVGEFFQSGLPRFLGPCGGYRTFGPNSNTGLRTALRACAGATGYHFRGLPRRYRIGAIGWAWPGRLQAHDGPCPGYFDADRFRWQVECLPPATDNSGQLGVQ